MIASALAPLRAGPHLEKLGGLCIIWEEKAPFWLQPILPFHSHPTLALQFCLSLMCTWDPLPHSCSLTLFHSFAAKFKKKKNQELACLEKTLKSNWLEIANSAKPKSGEENLIPGTISPVKRERKDVLELYLKKKKIHPTSPNYIPWWTASSSACKTAALKEIPEWILWYANYTSVNNALGVLRKDQGMTLQCLEKNEKLEDARKS